MSFRYIFSFVLLLIVMIELHEMVHIFTGWLICGCWGPRDFNVWSLCEQCSNRSNGWIATLAGPVFSFAMMWIGMAFLSSDLEERRALGFALIFANIPFGRLSGAMSGSGDEMTVLRALFNDVLSRSEMIIICSSVLFLIVVPPVYRAWRSLTCNRSWLYIIWFLTLPLVFLLTYNLTFMNGLLKRGFLSEPWIMGTPLLITMHTAIASASLLIIYFTGKRKALACFVR